MALAAADLVLLPPERLDGVMGPDLAYRVSLVADWLNRVGRTREVPSGDIAALCDRLLALGLPLDRYCSSTEVLDAEHGSVSRFWLRGRGVSTRAHGHDADGALFGAPAFRDAARSGRALELRPEIAGMPFVGAGEPEAEGYTQWLCIPVALMNGGWGWVTFATRQEGGFAPPHVAALGRLVPALAMLLDLRSTWRSLDKLLRAYVGDGPRRAILRGDTRRGRVATIRSAIVFADMRDSIGHIAGLEAAAAAGVFDAFFDCLVPPIERRGGEVLKYVGDGLLAIFRDGRDGIGDAADRALVAADEALRALHARNIAHPGERPIAAGVALHHGEVAYGNVGSGLRLDFTVIGRDVGLTSRIAGLNRPLGEAVLMSRDFAGRLRAPAVSLGFHALRGFAAPVEVFRPDRPAALFPGDAIHGEDGSRARPTEEGRR